MCRLHWLGSRKHRCAGKICLVPSYKLLGAVLDMLNETAMSQEGIQLNEFGVPDIQIY